MNSQGKLANIFPGGTAGTLFFRSETDVDESGNTKTICEVVGRILNCQTGADTVFFIFPPEVVSGTLVGGTVDVEQAVTQGCTAITLLVGLI